MAATTTYTSKPLVKGYLPRSYSATDLPDSSDTTYESIDTKILKVSRSIDSIIGAVYCSFNSVGGSPTTPHVIQDIATKWVVGLCLLQIGPGDRNSVLATRGDEYVKESMQRCQDMMGNYQPGSESASIPVEVVTTETLTFGTGGTYNLDSFEAFIMVHSLVTSGDMPYIIEPSVRPLLSGYTNYRYGVDFSVRFDPTYQKWVFSDHTGAFASDAGTKAITYRWDWRRATWAPKQASVTTTGLVGGF